MFLRLKYEEKAVVFFRGFLRGTVDLKFFCIDHLFDGTLRNVFFSRNFVRMAGRDSHNLYCARWFLFREEHSCLESFCQLSELLSCGGVIHEEF